MNDMVFLLKLIDTPFRQNNKLDVSDDLLLDIYDQAFKNRMALLYLTIYRRKGWNARLEEKYQKLKAREKLTSDVLMTIAKNLNEFSDQYIIFKSVKPYPSVTNDTDIIWLGDHRSYLQMLDFLKEKEYIFHEWAPQQQTYCDPRGKGKIGEGKKGGIYYIDLYEEISTDYFAYLNKKKLIPYIEEKKIDKVSVNLLRPEPELAIILFHSVFPERTYQMEHFYLLLYYVKKDDFDLKLFVDFSKSNKLDYAISTQITLLRYWHKKAFGFIPEKIDTLSRSLTTRRSEMLRFQKGKEVTPYMFSFNTFLFTFISKNQDLYSIKSLIFQFFKMLNPVFFIDVVKSLKLRLSKEGAYHLEK